MDPEDLCRALAALVQSCTEELGPSFAGAMVIVTSEVDGKMQCQNAWTVPENSPLMRAALLSASNEAATGLRAFLHAQGEIVN